MTNTNYTTNWIERPQKNSLRGTRIHGALPDESSVLVLMERTVIDMEPPRIRETKTLYSKQRPTGNGAALIAELKKMMKL